jgi:catechol 2,3-dioxygenase-like lactoylglutathione lyase family enzyme
MPIPRNRIIIFVGDAQRCARFYADTFGFAPVPSDQPADEWAELDTGGCRLAFHRAHGPAGPINTPTGGADEPRRARGFATSDRLMNGEGRLIRTGCRLT